MEFEQFEQSESSEQPHNISLEDLPGYLQEEQGYLYALIDMGALRDDLREDVVGKLENCSYQHLFDDPRYPQLKEFSALLVSGPENNNAALLDEWGGCNSDIVSAWIISKIPPTGLVKHLCMATFAYDPDNTEYVLRYYEPRITPILHRVADKEWVRWFFRPLVAWWYPIATPQDETWSRIEGEGKTLIWQRTKLVVSEELKDALITHPFSHQVLNYLEKEFPSNFNSDCYGVRLAQVEALLDAGKESGLQTLEDLYVYARAMFEDPALAEQLGWQAALKKAVANEAPLKTYYLGFNG